MSIKPSFICFFHFNAAANSWEGYTDKSARCNNGPHPTGEGFEDIPLSVIEFAGEGKIERKPDGFADIKPANKSKRAEVVKMLEALPR